MARTETESSGERSEGFDWTHDIRAEDQGTRRTPDGEEQRERRSSQSRADSRPIKIGEQRGGGRAGRENYLREAGNAFISMHPQHTDAR